MSGRHWVSAQPAYDCMFVQPCKFGSERCTPGSGGSHGRHGVDLTWFYGDPSVGVVQFKLHTNWMLDETWSDPGQQQWMQEHVVRNYGGGPLLLGSPGLVTPTPADLGYHWPTPRYDDQMQMDECHLLDLGYCYYDGSGLNAEEPWRILRYEGDKGLQSFLESYYASLVGDPE